jgi:hypothetical protein
MSDQWGTREQLSERDPGRLRAEHAYLFLAAVTISAAAVLYTVDTQWEGFEINRGAYSILVALFVAGYCGWLSRSAERRMRRIAVGELRRMSATIDRLERQVHNQRFTYPPTPRHNPGQRYIGAVAVGAEDDATSHPTVGLDPESIAAIRRINSRLRSVDNE